MKKLKNLFGNVPMTWPRVLLLAVGTAVLTALMLILPFLKDTSFQDIGINPECWILFAVFIVVNCRTWWDASLKTFVFFLVSQPLIYLLQVPFSSMGWGLFGYYGYWFRITLLTLPGAAIAFLVKKRTWLSAAVLSVATAFLAFSGVQYLRGMLTGFPHHLLSCLFCFGLAVFLILILLDEKKHRLAALALVLAVTLVTAAASGLFADHSVNLSFHEGDWVCTAQEEGIVKVVITDGHEIRISPLQNGVTELVFSREDGQQWIWYATVSSGEVFLSEVS